MEETLEAVGVNPIKSVGNGLYETKRTNPEVEKMARDRIRKILIDKMNVKYADTVFQDETKRINEETKLKEEGRKIAYELQKRLVQCCLNFINETGNTEIGRVSFIADMLQESAKYREWQPCTDSTCRIENNNGEEIGFSA